MSMTFKISNQDVHTKQANQKSFQTKRQHCCDPQCSSYKILSILITVYFCFTGTDDTLTPGKTESDTGPEVREEIVRRLNEESEKEVKKNKDRSDFELPAEICQPL